MYKSYTADDYRKYFEFDPDYKVEGVLVFGNYRKSLYQTLKDSLKQLGYEPEYRYLPHEFLENILEFKIDGKNYWFTLAYGGALLSEYLHLGNLFGSKKNILLGSCGGLKKGAKSGEIIIPTWSYAEESSAKAYRPDDNNKYYSDDQLSEKIAKAISDSYTVHREPTITYQAMLGETLEDIQKWSKQGYSGVEMESATVFAISNHFEVPSAAILYIADNLIEGITTLDPNYQESEDERKYSKKDTIDYALIELIGR